MGSSKKGRVKDTDKLKEEAKAEKKKEEKPKVEKKLEPRAIVRVANTDLDGGKNLITALKGVKGVSHVFANAIVKVTGLDPCKKLGELDASSIEKIESTIKNPTVYGIPSFVLNRRKDSATGKDLHLSGADVGTAMKFDVRKEVNLKTYRGFRHMLGQPVRGQRTRSHFRHGRVVGVLRKEIKIQMAKAGVEVAPATGVAPVPKKEEKPAEKK